MRAYFLFTIFIFILAISSSLITKEKGVLLFSRAHTNLLKGFAILTVLWGHIGSAYGIGGIQWIAGIGVSLFLLCSGYGLEASFTKNGLAHFWKKRFIAVIVPYWIIYIIAAALTSDNFSFNLVIRILFFIQANWYVRYILIIYIVYWALKQMSTYLKLSKKAFSFLLLAAFLIWFVIESLLFAKADAPSLLARQMLSFPLGVIFFDYYAQIKNAFLSNTFKNNLLFFLTGLISIFALGIGEINVIHNLPYIFSNTIALFTVMPLSLVTIKFSCLFYTFFNNYLFKFLGSVSYEIYLIQYFSRNIVTMSPITLYLCFVFTLLISWLFYVSYNAITKKRSNAKVLKP